LGVDSDGRQRDPEFRPAWLRLDGDVAKILKDETADDVQAQASAVALWLGREERIENAVTNLFRNAASVVDDANHDVLAFTIGAHFDAARLGNRVEGVLDQI
jgi:hypothetical protein